MAKNYYDEIDKALVRHEIGMNYKTHGMDWICDRIDWCYKWKKITEKQMEELAARATEVLERR